MGAGILKKRIDLISTTKTADGLGGFTTVDKTEAASLPAAIWPTSAKEVIQAGAETMAITHRVRIRYRSVMDPAWRIKYGARYLSIVSGPIDPNEGHVWMDLLCKEVAT
jgi:SPP1 family predicted phage head-tail adaptor